MKTTLTELGKSKSSPPSTAGAVTPPIWKGIIPRLQLQVSERRLMMMFGDALAILVSILVALFVWSLTAAEPFNLEFIVWRAIWFIVLPFSWFILAGANDYFNLRVTARIGTSLARLARIELQMIVVYLVLFFFSSRDALPRLFVLFYSLLSFALIFAWRTWQPFLMGWSGFRRRAVIVGTGHTAATIYEAIALEASHDYEIVGSICSSEDTEPTIGSLPLLGSGADLLNVVNRYEVAELIVAYGSQLPGDVFQGMMTCYEQGTMIMPMPLLYEKITGRVPIEHVGEHNWSVVLPLESRPISMRIYFLVKRLIDIALSLVGLAVLAVLMPFLALLIKLDSPGPVFYKQDRVGRKAKTFSVVKLRSMIPDAERESGPQWSSHGDPRITRVGRLLRKMRLDELPQLFNVLRGEMSLVGPRPERPTFVARLAAEIPFYRTRLVVKPGITGWAQVCYPYGSSAEDAVAKLQYDLYYIRHQSINLDLQIMVRTLAKVLALQGR